VLVQRLSHAAFSLQRDTGVRLQADAVVLKKDV
jgi:hypothetical protein